MNAINQQNLDREDKRLDRLGKAEDRDLRRLDFKDSREEREARRKEQTYQNKIRNEFSVQRAMATYDSLHKDDIDPDPLARINHLRELRASVGLTTDPSLINNQALSANGTAAFSSLKKR